MVSRSVSQVTSIFKLIYIIGLEKYSKKIPLFLVYVRFILNSLKLAPKEHTFEYATPTEDLLYNANVIKEALDDLLDEYEVLGKYLLHATKVSSDDMNSLNNICCLYTQVVAQDIEDGLRYLGSLMTRYKEIDVDIHRLYSNQLEQLENEASQLIFRFLQQKLINDNTVEYLFA